MAWLAPWQVDEDFQNKPSRPESVDIDQRAKSIQTPPQMINSDQPTRESGQ
jgi:hypothetical protein